MADFIKNSDKFPDSETSNVYGINYTLTETGAEPIDIAFFKDHARIDFNTDDSLAQTYIVAARKELEKYCQKSFIDKTVRLTAFYLPDKYKLMHGPVNTVTTEGFENIGDRLKEGGNDIDISYTTTGIQDQLVKTAIATYAEGLYEGDEKLKAQAKGMLASYRNITMF